MEINYYKYTNFISEICEFFKIDCTNYIEKTYDIFTEFDKYNKLKEFKTEILKYRLEFQKFYDGFIYGNWLSENHEKLKIEFVRCFLHDYNSIEFVNLVKNINKIVNSKVFHLNPELLNNRYFSEIWFELKTFADSLKIIKYISYKYLENYLQEIDKIEFIYTNLLNGGLVISEIVKHIKTQFAVIFAYSTRFNRIFKFDSNCITEILNLKIRKRCWKLYKKLKAINAPEEILNLFQYKFKK